MDEDNTEIVVERHGSRLLRNPFDFGLVISIIGLLLTITVNVVTMYERLTRIETQMDNVRQSLVNNERIVDTVNENQGAIRIMDYRINELEQRMDKNGFTD